MCEIDWQLLLEYLKVFLGWPPIALAIALVFFARFRPAILGLLNRIVEGNLLGQSFKASPPPEQQRDAKGAGENKLEQAAQSESLQHSNQVDPAQVPLPPELQSDPLARNAVAFVKANPERTVVEYKHLLFSYNCERLFNLIYGTQISLLEFLASRPSEGATLLELAPFHSAHQKFATRTDYQLRDYVGFLVSFGVIAVDGPPENHRYCISNHGVHFLSYIKATYPFAWNQRAF